jgi:hypothetical protein
MYVELLSYSIIVIDKIANIADIITIINVKYSYISFLFDTKVTF